jgi:hypothetical protein
MKNKIPSPASSTTMNEQSRSVEFDEDRKVALTLGTFGHSDHRSLQISHGPNKSALTITFQRTLRVPDNNSTNSLPPSLGQFPLFLVQDYAEQLPEDMVQRGGIFMPLWQREGRSNEEFLIVLYTDNCLSYVD